MVGWPKQHYKVNPYSTKLLIILIDLVRDCRAFAEDYIEWGEKGINLICLEHVNEAS